MTMVAGVGMMCVCPARGREEEEEEEEKRALLCIKTDDAYRTKPTPRCDEPRKTQNA